MPAHSPFRADAALTQHSVDLCQALLRIDTTNPPGNEREAADLCATELRAGGLEPVILESAPGRANVVARLRATRDVGKPPLLLTAHPSLPLEWVRLAPGIDARAFELLAQALGGPPALWGVLIAIVSSVLLLFGLWSVLGAPARRAPVE